jgi:hypothetical protein
VPLRLLHVGTFIRTDCRNKLMDNIKIDVNGGVLIKNGFILQKVVSTGGLLQIL